MAPHNPNTTQPCSPLSLAGRRGETMTAMEKATMAIEKTRPDCSVVLPNWFSITGISALQPYKPPAQKQISAALINARRPTIGGSATTQQIKKVHYG